MFVCCKIKEKQIEKQIVYIIRKHDLMNITYITVRSVVNNVQIILNLKQQRQTLYFVLPVPFTTY